MHNAVKEVAKFAPAESPARIIDYSFILNNYYTFYNIQI